MSDGISVVIPCHNGQDRIAATLAHLARQRFRTPLAWEVILVDNGCTDRTAERARQAWPDPPPCPLRIVREERLGANFARERGVREARYDVVGFIDDDNWARFDWADNAHRILADHPEVAACGAYLEEALEDGRRPEWFARHKKWFAVGPQTHVVGDVTRTGFVASAGMALRRSAMLELFDRGFTSQLSCRSGKRLTSCGDTEWCYALRMAGWKIWHDPGRLRLRHFISRDRLRWSHVRRVVRGMSASLLLLEGYYNEAAVAKARRVPPERLWIAETLWWIRCLAVDALKACAYAFIHRQRYERKLLSVEYDWGRILGLLEHRERYGRTLLELGGRPWAPHGRGA